MELRALACSCLILFTAPVLVWSQEALDSALAGDKSYEDRNAPVTPEQRLPLHAGPVMFDVSASYSLEWNDNINYTSTNVENDFINRPQVSLRAAWGVTTNSTLSFGIGLGYEKYVKYSSLDQLLITPDSELAWDIRIKDFVFTPYDRFSYSQDVANQGALSGTAEFPRIENTIGLRVRWYPSRYLIDLGYGHYNFLSQSSTYDYLNRSSELFFGRAAYRFAEVTEAGLEFSAGLTSYDSTSQGTNAVAQSDNTSISVGPYVEWQVTPNIALSLHGGGVFYSFDKTSSTTGNSELNSYYASAEARQTLTDFFTHILSAQNEIQQGLSTNGQSIELLSVRYVAKWAFHRNATLSANFLYEHGQESGVEDYDRYWPGITLTLNPLEHWSVGLAYQYITKNSNVSGYDYRQNSVTFNTSYRF